MWRAQEPEERQSKAGMEEKRRCFLEEVWGQEAEVQTVTLRYEGSEELESNTEWWCHDCAMKD